MAEGQTATNPQTGERIVLRGGQWVPMGTAQSAPRPPRQSPRYSGPMPTSADEVFGSLIAQESGGRAGVRGPDTQYGNALGRTQVLPSTARGIARNLGIPYREDLLTGTTPEAAAYQDTLGRAYLEEGFRNTGNARDALMYYHGGPDRSLWGPKTNAYADEVLARWSQGGGVAPVDGVQAAPQGASIQEGATATNPETGERITFTGGQWVPAGPIEVEIDQGVQNINGRAVVGGVDRGPWEDYWAGQRRSQSDREARVEREASPEYQAAIRDARAGAENVPDQLRALGLGATYGFLTDINAEAQRGLQAVENAGRRIAGQEVRYGSDIAAQAARDAMRDAQAQYAAERPVENFALQAAGGFIAPGVGAGGRYITAAANPAQAMQRAMQVGTATGAAAGLGYGEGNLIERADDAAVGGVVGLGAGAIGQGAINLLSRPRAASASATRTLSREGTQLTPGAIGSRIPVLGPVLRGAEEAADTIPFVGAAVSAGRQRMTNTFNRAALNRVLGPLEEQGLAQRLPTGWREDTTKGAGYEAVRRVQNTVSKAYDDALEGVSVTPDQQFYDDLSQVTTEAAELMPVQMTEQLANILQNRVFRTLEFADSPMSGEQFKAVESVLGTLAREQRQGLTVENKAFASALDDTRGVLRDLVARQRPDRAPQIQAINRAYSNLVPIEEAAGSTASQAAEGVFTPNAIAQASARGQTRRQRAVGEGRMQDLTSAGKAVVSSRIGDSGTATRTALTTLSTGLAGTAAFVDAMTTGLTVAGVSAVYSKPFIAALNAAYRATDSRQATAAFREMEALARQNPALVPFYESALANATGLSQRDTPAIPQAQPSTPVPSPALQRVLQ